MVKKVKEKVKLSIDVIGVQEFIKAYVFLAIFLIPIFIGGGFNSVMSLENGLEDLFGLFYILIAIITFPFSISLFNLAANFFFGNAMIFGNWIFWLIFLALKYFILFALAPILTVIFILIVALTDSVDKWIVKYEDMDKNN